MGVLNALGQWMNNRQAKKKAVAENTRNAQQEVQKLFDMHVRNQDIDTARSMMRAHRSLDVHQALLSAVDNGDSTMVKLLLPKTLPISKQMAFLKAADLNNLALMNIIAHKHNLPLRSYVEAMLIAGIKQDHDLAGAIFPMHQGLQQIGWTTERILQALSSAPAIAQSFEQSPQRRMAHDILGALLTQAVLGQHHDVLALLLPLATGDEKITALYCVPDNMCKANQPAPLTHDAFALFLCPPADRSIRPYKDKDIHCLLEYSMRMDASGALIHLVIDAFPGHTFDLSQTNLGPHVAQWDDAVVRKIISATDQRGVFGLGMQSIEFQNDAMFFASIEHLHGNKDREYFLVQSAQQGRTSYVQYLVGLGVVRDETDMAMQWATHYRHQEIFDTLYPHANLHACLAEMKSNTEKFNNPQRHYLGKLPHDYALLEAAIDRVAITQSIEHTSTARRTRQSKM